MGKTVLDSDKRELPWSARGKVQLKEGLHTIALSYSLKQTARWWLQLYWRKPGGNWREIVPKHHLYHKLSVSTMYYWCDREKPRLYRSEFRAPVGKHKLHYFTIDEAGRREKVNVVDIYVER